MFHDFSRNDPYAPDNRDGESEPYQVERALGRIGCSLITISAGGCAIPRYPDRLTGA